MKCANCNAEAFFVWREPIGTLFILIDNILSGRKGTSIYVYCTKCKKFSVYNLKMDKVLRKGLTKAELMKYLKNKYLEGKMSYVAS